MINSNGFFTSDPISRLLSEETSSLGDFDDCLTVANVPIEGSAPSPKQHFSGMYCLVSVDSPPLSVQVKQTSAKETANDHLQVIARKWLLAENGIQYLQGICAPSLCSSEQLTTLIRKCIIRPTIYVDNICVGNLVALSPSLTLCISRFGRPSPRNEANHFVLPAKKRSTGAYHAFHSCAVNRRLPI